MGNQVVGEEDSSLITKLQEQQLLLQKQNAHLVDYTLLAAQLSPAAKQFQNELTEIWKQQIIPSSISEASKLIKAGTII